MPGLPWVKGWVWRAPGRVALLETPAGIPLFLAPDGVSGNLIFRTLVLVAGGYGYGAAVLMDKVFVDSSRVGGHYTKAIMIASALAGKDRS